MVMFVVGVVILFLGKPKVKEVPDQSVFKAGMMSAIALFGIAWMTPPSSRRTRTSSWTPSAAG
jgi:anaerobic C4-dicarboxylate transporter DcuA/anaerobic C4-dicarboxylate transporter DcuB